MDKYYKAKAKFGHVGKNKYLPKDVYVKASDGKAAAKIVRSMPRVKHHDPKAIIELKEISKDEYFIGRKSNEMDLYFQVYSIQEQKRLNAVDISDVIKEDNNKTTKYKKTHKRRRLKEELDKKECEKMIKGRYIDDYE